MAEKFKLIKLDIVSVLLTFLALICQCAGFFAPGWWTGKNNIGHNIIGMTSAVFCEVTCVYRNVLDIQGTKEWIFAVRLFESFGILFVFVATILAVVMIVLRKRILYTSLVYIHGAAAVFILIGVFIFLGFQSTLDKNLGTDGSLGFPFGLCLMAAMVCIVTSVVTGWGLHKHLLEWSDEDDDEGE